MTDLAAAGKGFESFRCPFEKDLKASVVVLKASVSFGRPQVNEVIHLFKAIN